VGSNLGMYVGQCGLRPNELRKDTRRYDQKNKRRKAGHSRPSVILALRGLKQEDCKFEANLGYINEILSHCYTVSDVGRYWRV
jgi:hypothetical protein